MFSTLIKPKSPPPPPPVISDEAAKEILKLSECTICFHSLGPPIYQCHNGHVLCNSCESKLETCPICRIRLSKTEKIRNRVMERVLNVAHPPQSCPHAVWGCTTKLSRSEMEDHSVSCKYRPFPICRYMGLECDVECNFYTFPDHLRLHNIRGEDLTGVISPEKTTVRRQSLADMITRQHCFEQFYLQVAQYTFLVTSSIQADGHLSHTVLVHAWGESLDKFNVVVEVKAKELGETWSWCGDPLWITELAPGQTPVSFTFSPSALLNSAGGPDPARVITWTRRVRFWRKRPVPVPICGYNVSRRSVFVSLTAAGALLLVFVAWRLSKDRETVQRSAKFPRLMAKKTVERPRDDLFGPGVALLEFLFGAKRR